MKKFFFLSIAMLVTALTVQAERQIAYLMTVNSLQDFPKENFDGVDQQPEYNAAVWFDETYVSSGEGVFISMSDLANGISFKDYSVLWINVDRVGLTNLEEAGFTSDMYAKIKAYVEEGGCLFLTKQASMINYEIGRIGYAPGFANGGYVIGGDVWTINAQLGLWPEIEIKFDRRDTPFFADMERSDTYNAYTYNEQVTYYETFPMVGAVARTDNNNMWTDMMRIDKQTGGAAPAEEGYTHYDNGNPLRLMDFEEDWSCRVLAVWGHVVDFCAPGLIEFQPNSKFKGTVVTLGFAAYQWGTSNNFIDNVKQLAANTINYLVEEAPVPTEANQEEADEVAKSQIVYMNGQMFIQYPDGSKSTMLGQELK